MYLIKVGLNIYPQHDVILPPITAKVVKSLILSKKIFPSLSSLVSSKDKNKPLFISNLEFEGRRLLSDGKDEVINVKKNSHLRAFISFTSEITTLLNEFNEGLYDTPYGKFYVSLDTINLVDIRRINVDDKLDKNILINFVTPALLSSKVLLPPSLTDKFRKVNVGFSLLPSVGLISAYAYKEYYSILGKSDNQEYQFRTFRLSVLTNALSRVVGYNLKPVTVTLGKDEKGNLRRTRGTIGWIEFDIVHNKLKKKVIKYLQIASFLGLGKSRGIGLGEIEVKFVDR